MFYLCCGKCLFLQASLYWDHMIPKIYRLLWKGNGHQSIIFCLLHSMNSENSMILIILLSFMKEHLKLISQLDFFVLFKFLALVGNLPNFFLLWFLLKQSWHSPLQWKVDSLVLCNPYHFYENHFFHVCDNPQ